MESYPTVEDLLANPSISDGFFRDFEGFRGISRYF